MIYSYNPTGIRTNRHQKSINGKRDNFERPDFEKVGVKMGIKDYGKFIDDVVGVVSIWREYAGKAVVREDQVLAIGNQHDLL